MNSQASLFEIVVLNESTSFQADSPANLSAMPGSNEARRMTVTSGRKCCALLKNASPLGLLVRTLLASSTWHSMMCLFRWKAKATRSGRLYFQLQPLAHGISDSESSLWPTPTVHGNHNKKGLSKNSGNGLVTAIKMWPTPDAQMGSGGGSAKEAARRIMGIPRQTGGQRQKKLKDFVLLFPTPTAHLGKDAHLPPAEMERDSLAGLLLRQGASGSVNPQWVEWLMGFPEDWTLVSDSKPLETP